MLRVNWNDIHLNRALQNNLIYLNRTFSCLYVQKQRWNSILFKGGLVSYSYITSWRCKMNITDPIRLANSVKRFFLQIVPSNILNPKVIQLKHKMYSWNDYHTTKKITVPFFNPHNVQTIQTRIAYKWFQKKVVCVLPSKSTFPDSKNSCWPRLPPRPAKSIVVRKITAFPNKYTMYHFFQLLKKKAQKTDCKHETLARNIKGNHS